ncbi:MAG: hypothetical protein K2K16_11460 [Ruminococcus sp.]|nr:hypothetical protein [Ruminococcus sp.]
MVTNKNLYEMITSQMSNSKSLADGITSIQKDTAIIMETLQLILTNMMLNKISDDIK